MGTTQQQPPQKEQEPTQTLTLELKTPSDSDTELRPIFITGNFNGWSTSDERFKMQKISKGHFIFSFPKDVTLPQPLEYKYVRGDWEHQELDVLGEMIVNRVITSPQQMRIVSDVVLRWMSYGLSFTPQFLPKKQLISDAFFMPSLGKYRRVRVLLPHDYQQQATKYYPVLYLNDGQNLADARSAYGNWAIDQKMAVLSEQNKLDFIVVMIEHGGMDRIREYTPTDEQGKNYMRFLVEVLKPHMDKSFRTKSAPAFTGIGGSSLGGLISLYTGLQYPTIFGRWMVFSPSLWVMNGANLHLPMYETMDSIRVYLYGGGQEGANMLPNLRRAKKQLENQDFKNKKFKINLSIDPKGQHTETRWGQEFTKAVEWLFQTTPV
jgi:predicted alpha/beta superfamily hydrolase